MPAVVAAGAWIAANAGTIAAVSSAAVAAGTAVDQRNKGKKAASSAEDAKNQATKDAKAKAAALKEASAKRSTMFDGNENNSQKSLLTAQKKKRRAISGAAGTRLTGGKLGSPATAGGATLLGQ